MDEKIIDLEALGAFKEKIEENAPVKDLGIVKNINAPTDYTDYTPTNADFISITETGVYKFRIGIIGNGTLRGYYEGLLMVSKGFRAGPNFTYLHQTLFINGKVWGRHSTSATLTGGINWELQNVPHLDTIRANVSKDSLTLTTPSEVVRGVYSFYISEGNSSITRTALLLKGYHAGSSSIGSELVIISPLSNESGSAYGIFYREGGTGIWKKAFATAEDLDAAEERITSLETRTNTLESEQVRYIGEFECRMWSDNIDIYGDIYKQTSIATYSLTLKKLDDNLKHSAILVVAQESDTVIKHTVFVDGNIFQCGFNPQSVEKNVEDGIYWCLNYSKISLTYSEIENLASYISFKWVNSRIMVDEDDSILDYSGLNALTEITFGSAHLFYGYIYHDNGTTDMLRGIWFMHLSGKINADGTVTLTQTLWYTSPTFTFLKRSQTFSYADVAAGSAEFTTDWENANTAEVKVDALTERVETLEDSEDFSSLEELEDYDNSYLKAQYLYTKNVNKNLLTGFYDIGNFGAKERWTNVDFNGSLLNAVKKQFYISAHIQTDSTKKYCFSIYIGSNIGGFGNDLVVPQCRLNGGSLTDMTVQYIDNTTRRYYVTFQASNVVLRIKDDENGNYEVCEPQLEEVDSLDATPTAFEMPDQDLINAVQKEMRKTIPSDLLNSGRNQRLKVWFWQPYEENEPFYSIDKECWLYKQGVGNHELHLSINSLRPDEVVCFAIENRFKKLDDDGFDRYERWFDDDGEDGTMYRDNHVQKTNYKKWMLLPMYGAGKGEYVYLNYKDWNWDKVNHEHFPEFYAPSATWKTYKWLHDDYERYLSGGNKYFTFDDASRLFLAKYCSRMIDRKLLNNLRVFICNSKTKEIHQPGWFFAITQRMRLKIFIAKVNLSDDGEVVSLSEERESRIVTIDGYFMSTNDNVFPVSFSGKTLEDNYRALIEDNSTRLVLRMRVSK